MLAALVGHLAALEQAAALRRWCELVGSLSTELAAGGDLPDTDVEAFLAELVSILERLVDRLDDGETPAQLEGEPGDDLHRLAAFVGVETPSVPPAAPPSPSAATAASPASPASPGPPVPPAAPPPATAAPTSDAPAAPPPGDERPIVVLLVGGRARRSQLRDRLRAGGYRVEIAHDPDQTLQRVRQPPAVAAVVGDDVGPDFHLSELVRRWPPRRDLPALVRVSAARPPRAERRNQTGPVAGVWREPFATRDLERLLGRRTCT